MWRNCVELSSNYTKHNTTYDFYGSSFFIKLLFFHGTDKNESYASVKDDTIISSLLLDYESWRSLEKSKGWYTV